MSYRNPGDIQIADPGAFMNAFNSVIEPYKAKLEQRAVEKKKLLEKYDAANAKLTASMDYPSWVEKYGSTKATAIKQMVEDDYIKNNRFAGASLSEQQAMLDEIQTNIVQGVKTLDAAVALDLREVLPSHLDNWTSTNKEFMDFLASKPDDSNDITIERQNGELGFSYVTDGQKKFISQSKMPKGAIDYKGRSAINQEIQATIAAGVKNIDSKFGEAVDLVGADQYLNTAAGSIYANIKNDPAKLETIFESLQIDFNGKEEGTGDFSYADAMADPKLKEIADQAITSYIASRIEDDSKELTRLKGKEREKQAKANEVYQAKLQATIKEQAKTAEKEEKYKRNLKTFLATANGLGFALSDDGTMKDPGQRINITNGTLARVEAFALKNGYELSKPIVDENDNIFGATFKLLGTSKTIDIKDGDTFTDLLYKITLGKGVGDATTLGQDIMDVSKEDLIDMGEFEANSN